MPTPIGHALAGLAVAWAADLIPGPGQRWRQSPSDADFYAAAGGGLTLACAVLPVLPDADLVVNVHRTWSHSVGAALFVGLLAATVAVRMGWPIWRVALMCAGAYGTHVLLDWLAFDHFPPRGIMALWPFSHTFYISGLDLFLGSPRQFWQPRVFVVGNLKATARELLVLAPSVALLWLIRVKAFARLASEVSGGHHPAQ